MVSRYASECWRPAHPSVSCAVVSPSLYVRFLRSWAAFRGLIGEAEYFDAAVSDTDKIQELLELVAWCASEGNQAGTIASKLSAVLHFHRINLQMELPTSPLIKRALKGVTRSHVTAGTRKECVARFRGIRCWKDKDWLHLGVRAAASFAVSSVGLFFSGKVGRNLRLAGRSGAPRALLDEERRRCIRGSGG